MFLKFSLTTISFSSVKIIKTVWSCCVYLLNECSFTNLKEFMFSKDNFLEEDERSFQKFEIYQLKISPFFFSISLSIDSITSFFWQFSLKQSFDFKDILEGIWNIYYHLFVGLCQYFFFICHPLFSMQDFDLSIYIFLS